ncbi:transcriptional regulator family: Fungal Specific TF and C2H2 zinc finger [Aspergillus niger]|nr:transcriptional regulator family: Fungal Specific TF and C2H2 zinc finger [Aspergillus niger]
MTSSTNGPGPSGKWTCEFCPESFARKEHLQRHEFSHLGLKPFRCDVCSRMFSRRDTLRKHQATHSRESDGEEPPCTRGRRRSQKACLNCAKAKQRCNGKSPCQTPEFVHSTLLLNDNPAFISTGSGDHVTFNEQPVQVGHFPFEDLAASSGSGEQHREDYSMYPMGHPSENAIHPHVLSLPSQGLGDAMAVDMNMSLPSGGSVSSVSTREDNDDIPSSQSDFFTPEESQAHRHCCTRFPETQPDEDVIAAENYGHVRPIPHKQYLQIFGYWKSQQCPSCASPFISLSFLNAMVQLYFEHHDPWMPFIHRFSFDKEGVSWVLILAVASVGCQYSNVEGSELYILGLQDLLQKALPKDATETISFDQTTLAQCLLLRNTGLLFSGYEDEILTSQYQRNMLTSVAKSVSANVADNIPSSNNLDTYEQWRRWVESESQRRIIYCIYVIECCYWIFKDVPSSMTLDDLKIALPCEDILWTSDFEMSQKHSLANPENTPSLKTAFSNPDLLNDLLNDNSNLSNLIILLTFNIEERRLLRSTQPWFAADMATGLNERKLYKWPDELASFRTALDDKCDPTIKRFSVLKSISNNAPTFLKVMFHVTNILRRMPLRCLYALSGWQVTVNQMTAAATSLSHWMQQNPTLARETLLQATTLFGVLYDETTGPGCHHLAFLVAGLYIWAYCIVGGEDGSTGANQVWKISQPPLRPDKTVPDDMKEFWIQGTLEAPIYVKGGGILSGPESAIRVLKGFRLALSSHTSWPSLRHGLIYSISEMIEGRFASHSPELKSSGQRKSVIRGSQA